MFVAFFLCPCLVPTYPLSLGDGETCTYDNSWHCSSYMGWFRHVLPFKHTRILCERESAKKTISFPAVALQPWFLPLFSLADIHCCVARINGCFCALRWYVWLSCHKLRTVSMGRQGRAANIYSPFFLPVQTTHGQCVTAATSRQQAFFTPSIEEKEGRNDAVYMCWADVVHSLWWLFLTYIFCFSVLFVSNAVGLLFDSEVLNLWHCDNSAFIMMVMTLGRHIGRLYSWWWICCHYRTVVWRGMVGYWRWDFLWWQQAWMVKRHEQTCRWWFTLWPDIYS